MRRESSFAFALCLGTFFTQSAFAECTTDVECKGDRVCVEGACVDPPTRVSEPASSARRYVAVAEESPAPAPHPTAPEAPRMVRRSGALFVGGIVALGLAPVGLIAAMSYQLQKDNCEMDTERAAAAISVSGQVGATPTNCSRFDGFIIGSMAASVALAGGGLAMLLVGVQKVPVAKETAKIRPWFSPTTAGLSLQTAF